MGFVEQVQYFFSNPAYLEAVNQMRGASDSVLGKLFFNKLLYFYFYFQNLTAIFDLYFWIEKIGLVSLVLFVAGLFKQKKMFTLPILLLLCLLLVPVGFLSDIRSTYYPMIFVPFIAYVVYRFLWSQTKKVRYFLLGLLILNLIVQYMWLITIDL